MIIMGKGIVMSCRKSSGEVVNLDTTVLPILNLSFKWQYVSDELKTKKLDFVCMLSCKRKILNDRTATWNTRKNRTTLRLFFRELEWEEVWTSLVLYSMSGFAFSKAQPQSQSWLLGWRMVSFCVVYIMYKLGHLTPWVTAFKFPGTFHSQIYISPLKAMMHWFRSMVQLSSPLPQH
jgi:hypothetical protein